MSLYTPVFPPCHEFSSSQKGSPEGSSDAPFGKQPNYVKYLRDLHLFLSTQNDVLSPPSRPNSPMFDYRAQKMKDKTRDLLDSSGGETWDAKWTRASHNLKLGCTRGRHWPATPADPCPPEQIVDWLLPDEEFEWVEWEKKREEQRRLKGEMSASQQIGNDPPSASGTKQPGQASSAGPSRSPDTARHQRPRGVSPGTLRAAEEKVKRWQASMSSKVSHDTTWGSSPASTREIVAAERKRETAAPQRSRTLDFAVVKSTAKPLVGKTRKGRGPHPAIRSDTRSVPSRKPPKLSTLPKVPQDAAPADVDGTVSRGPAETPPVKAALPGIANVSETPYLPPSFPAHLETSTPLPNSKAFVRAPPSPIPPVMLSTPPPSTPVNPDDSQLFPAESHATSVPSSLPPQVILTQSGKRSRASSAPVDGIDLPGTPPAKRLQTLSQNGSNVVSEHSRPISPSGEHCIGREVRDPSFGGTPSHRHPADSLEVEKGPPLTPVKPDQPSLGASVQDVPEKIPSPAKSVRSFFSAPDSDLADSPMKPNLLLESPVSPMLSYAQNPSVFLPQITSTQARKGSPMASQANNGIFGMGFSSQLDVERHVDRVSELLEKDVDFDGWLRDVRTVETSQD